MAPFKLKKIKNVCFFLSHRTEAENCLLDVLKVMLTKKKKIKVDLQYQRL